MEPTNNYNRPFRHLPAYQGFLNRRCLTLAEVLRSAGYQTFLVGKWHVGAEEGQRPLDRGFDRFWGLVGGASSHFFPKPGQIWEDREAVDPLPAGFYTTDAFAGQAVRYLRQADRDRPFFLYLAFTAPHWPLHAWPEDIAKYRGRYRAGWQALREERLARQKAMGLFPPELELSPPHPDAAGWTAEDADGMDLRMAVYAAMIDRMDQGIGTVLQALEQTGRAADTLVLFLSDNGACAEPIGKGRPEAKPADDPASFQGVLLPWANASNTPFRQFKHWTHEGGIATPLIAWWPAWMKARARGGLVHTPGHIIDLMPTLADLAGATYPATRGGETLVPLEGVSLRPILTREDPPPAAMAERVLFWEHEGNRAVRMGRWKLVAPYNENMGDRHVALGKRSGAWELFDLETDRTELHNLAGARPELAADLAARHAAWAARVGARDWEELLRMGGLDVIPNNLP